MKINLHNKFEVTTGGKTFVAYNTMLKSVFEKIAGLSPYNGYFAFGTGKAATNFDDTKLGSFVGSFACTTLSGQFDCTKGNMYVEKYLVFGENENNGFEFSEMGITDTADTDPIIFNRVVFTDDDGTVIKLTKAAGQEMTIKLTIFLEATAEGSGMLIAGNNKLIAQILGEDAITTRTLRFAKGKNNQPNVSIHRDKPTDTVRFDGDFEPTYLSGNLGVKLKYLVDFGKGETREVLVLADDEPVLRYNCLGARVTDEKTSALSKTFNNSFLVPGLVKAVTAVKAADNTELDIIPTTFASSFGETLSQPFDMPFDATTTRYVSKDGGLIAFVLNNAMYLYQNKDYYIFKIDTTEVNFTSAVSGVFMADDVVMLKLTGAPNAQFFKVADGKCVPLTLSIAENSGISFDLSGVDMTITKNGIVRVCGINSAGAGECVFLTIDGNTISATGKVTTTDSNITDAVALYKNNFCDSLIFFLTTEAGGIPGVSAVEWVNASGEIAVHSTSAMALNLTSNCVKLSGNGRVMASKKNTSSSSLYNTYFFPECKRYNVEFNNEIDMFVSPDFNYCVKKFSDETYKIYHLVGFGTPVEFSNGFDGMEQSTFVDFQFLADTLLIFTSAEKKVIAINLDKSNTCLEGFLEETPASLNVSYICYEPLGARAYESVEATIGLTVSGFEGS